jgi:hypothetical protein
VNRMMGLETFIAEIDRGLFTEGYAPLSDPLSLRDTVFSHLTAMWDVHLAAV